MSAGFTPGPWEWGGQPGEMKLQTVHQGKRYVMGFRRKGMKGAQPEFQCNGRMLGAVDDLVTFQVGDLNVRGDGMARVNQSVYRYDISGVDHPDARLIAASPDLHATILALLPYAEHEAKCFDEDNPDRAANAQAAVDAARKVLAKVEGV